MYDSESIEMFKRSLCELAHSCRLNTEQVCNISWESEILRYIVYHQRVEELAKSYFLGYLIYIYQQLLYEENKIIIVMSKSSTAYKILHVVQTYRNQMIRKNSRYLVEKENVPTISNDEQNRRRKNHIILRTNKQIRAN